MVSKIQKLLKVKRLLKEVVDYNVTSKFKVLSPKALMVVLTYKCNSRCQMCNIWQFNPGKEMPLDEWKKVAKDPVFKEVETLTISGGEGMLYPEYLEAVETWIRDLPKLQKLILNTNGFLPEDIIRKVEFVQKVCEKKGVRLGVSVSVDGTEEKHNEIRRVKDGFKKVLKTIEHLEKMKKDGKLDFGVASVLMENNLSNYWELKKWFVDRGLSYSFQLIGFHDTYVNNIESQKNLDFKKSQKKELQKVIADIRKNQEGVGFAGYYWADMSEFYKGKRRRTPCPFLLDEVVVDSIGDVYYCLSAKSIGNIFKEKRSVGEIYFDQANLLWRKNMWNNECRRCNSGCDVVRAIAGDAGKFIGYKLTGRI
jgi:MoaA/NifB/PqqE/SkfB family radical SAM enzyme